MNKSDMVDFNDKKNLSSSNLSQDESTKKNKKFVKLLDKSELNSINIQKLKIERAMRSIAK